jgi:hypothetical protein
MCGDGPRDTARAPLAPLVLPVPEPVAADGETSVEVSRAQHSPMAPSSPEWEAREAMTSRRALALAVEVVAACHIPKFTKFWNVRFNFN